MPSPGYGGHGTALRGVAAKRRQRQLPWSAGGHGAQQNVEARGVQGNLEELALSPNGRQVLL